MRPPSRLVLDAAQDPRNDRTALLVLLVPVFRVLGRIEEAERLVENRWERLNASRQGAAEPAIRLVRQHIELTLQPEKVETLRGLLGSGLPARPRRRSRLARSCEPGHPDRRPRRGEALARCLPGAPSGGCTGLAGSG